MCVCVCVYVCVGGWAFVYRVRERGSKGVIPGKVLQHLLSQRSIHWESILWFIVFSTGSRLGSVCVGRESEARQ